MATASKFQAFFAQNVSAQENEKVIVSRRFKDPESQDGAPLAFEIRALNEDQHEEIRKKSTIFRKGRGSSQTQEFDNNKYMANLAVAAVVYPDLKDAELQASYGVKGEAELIKKMLLAGEFATLLDKVQEISGFDMGVNELAAEVKN